MNLPGKNVLYRCISPVWNEFDLWLFPAVIVTAWFYYSSCEHGPSLCIWKAIFHRPCFGCGLTRGVCFLVHGHLREAVRFNPLSVPAILLMAVSFAKALTERCQSAAISRVARVSQLR